MSSAAREQLAESSISGIRRAASSVAEPARGSIVAIHGAGHSADAFVPLFAEPALGAYECVAIDLPGRHGSLGPAAETAEAAAARVAEVIRLLALPSPVVVVGHSFGGGVAIELALEDDAPIDGLVLVSTGARLRVLPANLERFAAVARGELPRLRGLGFSEAYARDHADRVKRFEAAMDAVPAATALADWHAADRFDRLADASRITAPTLIVGGDDDPFTPYKYAAFLHERIAGSSLASIVGGSHLACVEAPRELARMLADFIRTSLPSRRSAS